MHHRPPERSERRIVPRQLGTTLPAAAISDNTNQEEEQTMTIYEDLMKAVRDDARRAGERDRLLLEARRGRKARRQRLVPAALARRRTEMGKLVVSENVTLDGVIHDPAGDEGFRVSRWVGLIGRLSRRMAAQPGMAPKASPSLTSPASNADSCRTMAHDRG
jgi:hypothetical protein